MGSCTNRHISQSVHVLEQGRVCCNKYGSGAGNSTPAFSAFFQAEATLLAVLIHRIRRLMHVLRQKAKQRLNNVPQLSVTWFTDASVTLYGKQLVQRRSDIFRYLDHMPTLLLAFINLISWQSTGRARLHQEWLVAVLQVLFEGITAAFLFQCSYRSLSEQ